MKISGEKWVIVMFMGEYHQKIDDKSRLTIPAKLRNELGNNFIVTRGLDGCLFIYKKETWEKIVNNYQTLPNVKEARNFMRFFLSGATTIDCDKQGRINITQPLINHANLNKDTVIIGVGDRLEVWDSAKWENLLSENEENFSEMADNLFSQNLN